MKDTLKGQKRGDEDNSSSSSEKKERQSWKDVWCLKFYQKIEIPENVENLAAEKEKQVAEWMVWGQSKWSKPITIPKSFAEKVREDPISFLKNLVVDAKANGWDKTDFLEVIGGFLKDDAKE